MDENKVETLRKMVREARLKVTPEAEDKLARDVAELLHNVDVLAEVDAGEGIQRLTMTPDDLRADVTDDSISRDEAQANAPDARDGFIVVPRVLPGEGENDA